MASCQSSPAEHLPERRHLRERDIKRLGAQPDLCRQLREGGAPRLGGGPRSVDSGCVARRSHESPAGPSR